MNDDIHKSSFINPEVVPHEYDGRATTAAFAMALWSAFFVKPEPPTQASAPPEGGGEGDAEDDGGTSVVGMDLRKPRVKAIKPSKLA